jgi:DnaJ-class molecular chaperone
MASGGKRDLYEILGVPRDADAKAIKKAYRKLARQYHPDVNPGDEAAEERFKGISEAYAVLSDPEKRRNYDEFGEVSLEGGFDADAARRAREAFGARFGTGGRPGGFPGFGGDSFGGESFSFDFGNLEDLLGRHFGGHGRGRGRSMRGDDTQASIELDFLEAARGGEKRLTITRPNPSGAPITETVTVRIPPGVADGGRIRLPQKGSPGLAGGPAGDLWATIRVRPHPVFRREGRNLHLEVPISIREAIRGAKIEIPTLEGRATLTVPPGTDSGRKLRLRGKGIADPGGGPPGDLYVTVQIRVPRDLSEEAKEKVDELAGFDPPDLRKELFQ